MAKTLPRSMIEDALAQLNHQREVVEFDKNLSRRQRAQRIRRLDDKIKRFLDDLQRAPSSWFDGVKAAAEADRQKRCERRRS